MLVSKILIVSGTTIRVIFQNSVTYIEQSVEASGSAMAFSSPVHSLLSIAIEAQKLNTTTKAHVLQAACMLHENIAKDQLKIIDYDE